MPAEVDFQHLSKKINEDAKLMQSLGYVTEYIRQVIENGTSFTQNHFFMLLLHLTHEDVTAALCKFLKVIIAEFGVTRNEFERFLAGLNDHELLVQFRKGMSLMF